MKLTVWRLVEQFLIHLRMDMTFEVHNSKGKKLEVTDLGIQTKRHLIGGREENIFVIRVKER